jgi:hypothetical protein
MSELKAAAERRRARDKADRMRDEENYYKDDDIELLDEMDRLTDPTLVNSEPEWLLGVGFKAIDNLGSGYVLYDKWDRGAVSIGYRGQLLVYGSEVPAIDEPTRGDIRSLCLGMNLPLTE